MDENLNSDDESVLIGKYAEKAYLEYAMSVVKGRALPNLDDGQKNSSKKNTFTMKLMGLSFDTKPIKSAKVVGNMIGNYHPHGDTSAYEAMVRMAQSFTLRYPLIDGIGNFGSRDGDNAAAMRYTEARLTPIADLLLSELNLDTVDFTPNYDGSLKEPVVLPARLPFILLNGATGIAVGMSTDIPSHNLREVGNASIALLKNKDMDTGELLAYIQGPDFASGSHIISSHDEILNIYNTGKGSVRVKAKYHIEKLAKGDWRVIINELPINTSTQKILTQIEEQINPKPRVGKKSISQEQVNTKNLILSILDKVRDESDSAEPIRIVLEPKSKKIDVDYFINNLMALTDLEINIPINLVMVGNDGNPAQKNLKTILQEWLDFRLTVVDRKLNYRFNELSNRIHIIEGRMEIFIHIDEVIKIIKESNHPKKELMKRFELTEKQTEDILEIKLRQLAKLEWIKLEKELQKLKEELEKINYLINNYNAKEKYIIKEIRADIEKYGDERRTLIKEDKKSVLIQKVVDEQITIILSEHGWIRLRVGHNLDLSTISFKDGDNLKQIIETRTSFPIILLDSQGQSYTIHASEIPSGRGDGIPVNSLIHLNLNSKIINIVSGHKDKEVLLSSSNGYGFITKIADMLSKNRAGKNMITVKPTETSLPAIEINKLTEKQGNLILVSSEEKILAFPLSEVKYLPRGKGLQLINLNKTYELKYIMFSNQEKYNIIIKNYKKDNIYTETLRIKDTLGKRAGKGKIIKISGEIIGIQQIKQ